MACRCSSESLRRALAVKRPLTRLLGLTWRVGWVAVIFAIAVWTLAVAGRVRQAFAPPEDLPGKLAAALDVELSLADFLDGCWQFADSPWRIRIVDTDPAAAAALLDRAPEPLAGRSAGAGDVEILSLLDRLQARAGSSSSSGRGTLEQAGQGWRVKAFVSGPRNDRVDIVRVATASEAGMRVFEVCPAAEPHLDGPAAATLPLPSPARLVGTRYGIQGRVVGQLAEFAGPADALWGAWLAAGWQVEVREANATAAQHALCCKGSVRWHVWLWKNGRQPGIVLATRIA